uniref:Uncharacterized protein n=1 Tax=Caenorhabditis japonica TaxID=281687 RepID=A0A8R1DPZ1_CAEJA
MDGEEVLVKKKQSRKARNGEDVLREEASWTDQLGIDADERRMVARVANRDTWKQDFLHITIQPKSGRFNCIFESLETRGCISRLNRHMAACFCDYTDFNFIKDCDFELTHQRKGEKINRFCQYSTSKYMA